MERMLASALIVLRRTKGYAHTPDKSVDIKAATPETMIVAVVSFSPVPPAILSAARRDASSAVGCGDGGRAPS